VVVGYLGDIIGIDDAILLMMLVGGAIALGVPAYIRKMA